jgi:hypothetical protein|tara:strand:- start:52 stop:591 length:540 start_codon:yes stop_codon:yes gene_type:complete
MDRYKVIANLARQKGWTTGAELGVWVGVTTFHLMRNTQLKMYAVDCWEEQPDNPEYDWQYNEKPKWSKGNTFVPWDHNKNEKQFREQAEQYADRITIIKGRSLAVVDQIPDASLDFIFHDSDHSHPFVMNEINAYRCKLKPGGYHMGDDLNWDPVRESVEACFGKDYTVTGKDCWYKQI